MKLLKKGLKLLFLVISIPVTYLLVSLILTYIPVNANVESKRTHSVYLSTNGIHLDIIIPIKNANKKLLKGIKRLPNENYLAFGWGDEEFYLNTQTMSDLTIKTAFSAMFLKTQTLMHVTRYRNTRKDWVEVTLSNAELDALNTYILQTFQIDNHGYKLQLEGQGYSYRDDFYKAKGSYSCLKTCNSWANSAFKESRLKSCLWTPFDFGLLNMYKS